MNKILRLSLLFLVFSCKDGDYEVCKSEIRSSGNIITALRLKSSNYAKEKISFKGKYFLPGNYTNEEIRLFEVWSQAGKTGDTKLISLPTYNNPSKPCDTLCYNTWKSNRAASKHKAYKPNGYCGVVSFEVQRNETLKTHGYLQVFYNNDLDMVSDTLILN